jgi:uncharacterized protein YqgC (DUF456 family)
MNTTNYDGDPGYLTALYHAISFPVIGMLVGPFVAFFVISLINRREA